jgi:hypothetical protein
MGEPGGDIFLRNSRCMWDNNIKINFRLRAVVKAELGWFWILASERLL